jgi:hypothetical protein
MEGRIERSQWPKAFHIGTPRSIQHLDVFIRTFFIDDDIPGEKGGSGGSSSSSLAALGRH